MEYVEWCNLCHSEPATGELTGYFADLPEEVVTVMACSQCAQKGFQAADYGV